MQIMVNVRSRIMLNPPGLAPGSYVELTTSIQYPVTLRGFVLPWPAPPSVSVQLFGPINPALDIKITALQIETDEKERIRTMFHNMGC